MATDFFLKIDGVKGESMDKTHKDEINVESWSWGASQSVSSATQSGGLGAGKVSISDFNFTMAINKASTELFLLCCNGKHIPSASFVARKAGDTPVEFFKVKLSDIIVSSYQVSGHG